MGRVAAVSRDAADFIHILADERIVAPALAAVGTRAPKPANARPCADAPPLDVLTDRVDDADHLVARHARILDDWEQALDRHDIAVTDAARLDADADLFARRNGKFAVFLNELTPTLSNDHCAHFRHRDPYL